MMPSNAATDTMSITATVATGGFSTLKVIEYTGQALSSPLDGITAWSAQQPAGTITSPSLVTHASNETLICCGANETSGYTNGSGWATRSGFDSTYMAIEDQDQASYSTYTGTFGSSAGVAQALLLAVKSTTSIVGHAISGSLGASGASATITFWGTAYGTATADGSGDYSIGGLADGTYYLKPALAGRIFTPFTKTQALSGANVTGVDFTSVASTSGFLDTTAWFAPDGGLFKPFASGAYGEVPGIVEVASQNSINAAGNSLADLNVIFGSFTYPGGYGQNGPGTVVLKGGTLMWNKLALLYGTIEARSKLTGLNTHATVWAVDAAIRGTFYQNGAPTGDNNGVTYGDEIDIFEAKPLVSGDTTTGYLTTYHGNGSSGGNTSSAPISDYSTNFHIYKIVWTPSAVTFYVDGVQKYTTSSNIPTHPLMFIMDIEAADTAAGTASTGNFPQDYQIDYVKAWDSSGNLVFYDEFDGSPAIQIQEASNLRFLQGKSAVGTVSTTQVLTPTYATASQSWLLALGVVAGTGAVTMSVTDALTNTWTQVGSNWDDGTNTYAVFQVAQNKLSGGANAITLHSSRSAQLNLVFGEYCNQLASAPVDVTATGSWASTSASIGPVVSTGPNESIVAIAWMAADTAASAADGTIQLNADGSTTNGLIEDRSLSTAGSATASWTNGAGGGSGMVLAIRSTSTDPSIGGNCGIAGATVSCSGGSAVSDSAGNYIINGLAPGSYTITPSLTGYSFSPTSASETVSGADITGVNFTATNTPVATTTFSPAAGTYTSAQTVTFNNTNSGLTGFAMYWNTTGSPTTGSTLYTGPITVSVTETVYVLAVATGYANSAIGSAAYIINIPSGGSSNSSGELNWINMLNWLRQI